MSAALLIAVLSTVAYQESLVRVEPRTEVRYCGAPARDARGVIVRSPGVRAAFKRAHPCPATGLSTGACPGWIMDHVIPLACGGCDAVVNLQWLTVETWRAKSLWERRAGVYSVGACGR